MIPDLLASQWGTEDYIVNWFWIIVWYLVCALFILAFRAFYNLLNRPAYRGSDGEDVSTEVGYEENAVGKPLDIYSEDECVSKETPHVPAPGGTTHTGAM